MSEPENKPPEWKPMDARNLRARLAEVRSLLVQAAAVGMAQDTERMEKLAELERKLREPVNGPTRRYR